MEKKHRNHRINDTVKDRGDSRKDSSIDRLINTYSVGDTAFKTQPKTSKYKEEKSKTLTKEEINKLEVFERLATPKKVTEFSERFENQIKTYLDVEGRRRLRERYTVKLNKNQCLIKSDAKPEIIIDSDKEEEKKTEEQKQERINSPAKSEIKIEKPRSPPQRKPIIKTITVKNRNDNRVYKAVTFVDNNTALPLQVKIPITKRKSTKSTEVNFPIKAKVSKVSIKEKPKKEKKFNKKRITTSPDVEDFVKKSNCPPTEVAKWVPSCLTGHTKPYYEAWVDTTLAAISKCSQEETEKLIKTLQRPDDDLFYENFKDERFTGKIKIRQKNVSKS